MSMNRLEGGDRDWTAGYKFELICDKCGEVGVKIGEYDKIKRFLKLNKWKSKGARSKDYFAATRYVWAHFCRKCKKEMK